MAMFARVKPLELDGTPHTGRIEAGGVAVYSCEVSKKGRYRFHSRAEVILILELGDDPGNIIARKSGRECEITATLAAGPYFVSLSGATIRTEGDYELTGVRV